MTFNLNYICFGLFVLNVSFTTGKNIELEGNPSKNVGIVNGIPAKLGDIPYIVSIRKHGYHVCGGAIVSDFMVVSAAHCAYISVNGSTDAGSHSIQYGVIETYAKCDEHCHEVALIQLNPDYFDGTNINDIALFESPTKFRFSDNVKKIALPSATNVHYPVGFGIMSGFGYLNNQTASNKLHYASTVYMDNFTVCNELIQPKITDSLFQANACYGQYDPDHGVTGQCYGDDGGPFVLKVNGVDTLVGVQTWFITPCGYTYGTLVRVSPFIDWIKYFIAKE